MEVIPALDLLGGRAVRLLRGVRAESTDMGDPIAWAERFAADGARRLHLVDLDGAFEGWRVHASLIARIAAILPVQVGGGLRTSDDVARTFDLGVERVVIGTAAVVSPALLDEVAPDRLVVGVDIKNGRVAVHGWETTVDLDPGAFVEALAARGVRRILCTAVHRDGTLEGPDAAVLAGVVGRGCAVQASGGVGELAHLRDLAAIDGVESAIVGKAILTGRFTYAEAVAAC
jgi:phosphoribosylformimino-5-aminoimidazole carboxamide ribotide isomerase